MTEIWYFISEGTKYNFGSLELAIKGKAEFKKRKKECTIIMCRSAA